MQMQRERERETEKKRFSLIVNEKSQHVIPYEKEEQEEMAIIQLLQTTASLLRYDGNSFPFVCFFHSSIFFLSFSLYSFFILDSDLCLIKTSKERSHK